MAADCLSGQALNPAQMQGSFLLKESVLRSCYLVCLCLICQRKSKIDLLVCPAESSLAFAFLLVQLWPNFISGVKLLESPRLPLPPLALASRSLHSVQVVLTSLLLFLSRSDGLTAELGPNSPNRSGVWLISWKDQCLGSWELGSKSSMWCNVFRYCSQYVSVPTPSRIECLSAPREFAWASPHGSS